MVLSLNSYSPQLLASVMSAAAATAMAKKAKMADGRLSGIMLCQAIRAADRLIWARIWMNDDDGRRRRAWWWRGDSCKWRAFCSVSFWYSCLPFLVVFIYCGRAASVVCVCV